MAAIPQAVCQLRQFTRRIAEHWGLSDELIDTLCLIVSEYGANAARHSGGTHMALLLSRSGGLVTVLLRDNGHWQQPRPQLDGESGRGLPMVAACATASGRHRSPSGTTAWAQLATAPADAPC